MVADSPRRFGLAIAAASAIAACSGSALKISKAQDSGTNSPDLESRSDLRAEDNPVYKDSSTDPGVVTADTGPATPPLGSDSASPDTAIIKNDAGRDGSIVQRDAGADRVAQDVASDSLGDSSILSIDGGGVDTGLAASLTISGFVSYAEAPEGETSSPMSLTVSNVGTTSSGTFTITITGTDAGVFEITSNSCDKPLPAGESCQVTLVFHAPTQGGSYSHASLNIVADGLPGGAFAAPLTGETA